jgi:beta-glucanase (GH16 family)
MTPLPLTKIIPSYLYTQYADDDALQAFVMSHNAITQGYLDWFNEVSLPVYTGEQINGFLLDWVGAGIYGIKRPTLTSGVVVNKGPVNTYEADELDPNQFKVIFTGGTYKVNDDAYKRILTWWFYKGDGFIVSVPWLKRRIARFLNGTGGRDTPSADVSKVWITLTAPNSLAITIPKSDISDVFVAAVQSRVINLPVQFTFSTTVVNYTNLSGVGLVQHNISTAAAIVQQQRVTSTNSVQSNICESGDIAIRVLGLAATQANLVITGALTQTHNAHATNSVQANAATSSQVVRPGVVVGINIAQTNTSGTGAIKQINTVHGGLTTQNNSCTVGWVAVAVTTAQNVSQTNAASVGSIAQKIMTGVATIQSNAVNSAGITQMQVMLSSSTVQNNAASAAAVNQAKPTTGENTLQINSASTAVTVEPPQVAIIAPSAGASVSGTVVTVTADAHPIFKAEVVGTVTPSTYLLTTGNPHAPITSDSRYPLSDQDNTLGWVVDAAHTDEFNTTSLNTTKWWDHMPYANQGADPTLLRPTVNGLDFRMRLGPTTGQYIYRGAYIASTTRIKYGYIEVCTRIAQNYANSNSFLYAQDPNNSATGLVEWTELDIYEIYGLPATSGKSDYLNAHIWLSPTQPLHIESQTHFDLPVGSLFSNEFHVFGFEWRPTVINWYLDGYLIRSMPNASFHQPLNLLHGIWDLHSYNAAMTAAEVAASFMTVKYCRVWTATKDPYDIAGVQLKIDGSPIGSEILTPPYSATWNTTSVLNGNRSLSATARNIGGAITNSSPITVNVANGTVLPDLIIVPGSLIYANGQFTITVKNIGNSPTPTGFSIGARFTIGGVGHWRVTMQLLRSPAQQILLR